MKIKNNLNNNSGMVLVAVVGIILVIALVIPMMVEMLRNEARWSVKQQETIAAFQLAQAGVDRALWKLKSSTSTYETAAVGTTITGYNFDVDYSDIEGGEYRIQFSSGPGDNEVTVVSEGRDTNQNHVRAIQIVVENKSVPAGVVSAGSVEMEGNFEVHWGPVMAQNNINISGANASQYFPRKFSKQVVTGTGSYPRDTNGLSPPNTDNVEWWSDYPVVDLPLIDFAALRSSAAATTTTESSDPGGTTTLNYYRKYDSKTGYYDHGVPDEFHGTNAHDDAESDLVWYWDGDLELTGGGGWSSRRNDLRGTIIVMGNLTISEEDQGSFTVNIPEDAYLEYQKMDTSASNEYPGDTGLASHSATFPLGGQTWTGGPTSASFTDVGLSGFIYVGGNLILADVCDMYGAIWVAGSVSNPYSGEATLLFFNDELELPTLNVVLVRKSWQEVTPTW